MPYSSPKPCKYPGCPNLTRSGYCEEHQNQAATRSGVSRRNPDRQRLYGRRWGKRRAAHLASHPWCEDCLEKGIYTPATDVHHEQRHQGDRLVFDTSPLRSLCHSCHSRRTAEEVRNPRGAKKVLEREVSSAVGLPCEKNSQCGESS